VREPGCTARSRPHTAWENGGRRRTPGRLTPRRPPLLRCTNGVSRRPHPTRIPLAALSRTPLGVPIVAGGAPNRGCRFARPPANFSDPSRGQRPGLRPAGPQTASDRRGMGFPTCSSNTSLVRTNFQICPTWPRPSRTRPLGVQSQTLGRRGQQDTSREGEAPSEPRCVPVRAISSRWAAHGSRPKNALKGPQKLAGGRAQRYPRNTRPPTHRHPEGVRERVVENLDTGRK
jgi:hypothetical protein